MIAINYIFGINIPAVTPNTPRKGDCNEVMSSMHAIRKTTKSVCATFVLCLFEILF